MSATIWPSSQQAWYTAGPPDPTLVLGQGGTIYVGDMDLDNTTGRMYIITAVGSFNPTTQTYINCTFKEMVFSSNIGSFVGINTARAYSAVSSPAFNTSRQPNPNRDVSVIASVTLVSVLLGSAKVTPQVSADNSTWVSLAAPNQVNIAASFDWPISFVVPAGYYYRLVNSTSGVGATATLNSIQELSN